MTQPKQSRSKRTRQERTYRRRETSDRATAALDAAAAKRVERVALEMALGQLDLMPEEDRGPAWATERKQAADGLSALDRDVKALEARGAELYGKPIGRTERRQRNAQVKQRRIDEIEKNLAAWESTMDSHDANLDRLEAVPVSVRASWHTGEGQVWRGAASGVAWEEAWEAEEEALAIFERAIEAGEALLKAEQGG